MFRKIISKTRENILIKYFKFIYPNSSYYFVDNLYEKKIDLLTYSQHMQDVVVSKYIFNKKKEGYFVDVGCNHPINLNNTYLLELNGWKGLAIDPLKEFNEIWSAERTTEKLDLFISDKVEELTFYQIENQEEDWESMLSTANLTNELKKFNPTEITVKTQTLKDIFISKNIRKVDALFIDVENYDFEVLKGIDFKLVDINLIIIENVRHRFRNFDIGSKNIRNHLKNRGFQFLFRINGDDYFQQSNYLKDVNLQELYKHIESSKFIKKIN